MVGRGRRRHGRPGVVSGMVGRRTARAREMTNGHTFRRTVATLLDEAGLPIALAANQLGHADPAMTARVYLGRRGSTAAAGAVL